MRKYQRALFDVTFDNILSRFVEKFIINFNDKSPVLYQSLFFINEIFSEYNFDFNYSWLEQLYPPVEEYVFNSNEQVSQLAKMVIRSFAVNMKYSTTIEVLLNSLLDAYENESRVQFVNEMFELYCTTLDKINLVYGFDWNDIIQNLTIGNEKMSQIIQHILLILKKVLGSQWGEYVNSFNENNLNLVNKIMTSCT